MSNKFTRESVYGENAFKKDKKIISGGNHLDLQIVTFNETELQYLNNSPDEILADGETRADERYRYVPQIVGVTKNGSSVCVNVFGFAPFFLIQCPEFFETRKRNKETGKYETVKKTWKKKYINDVEAAILHSLSDKGKKHHLLKVEYVQYRKFRTFTNFEKFPYIRVTIDNMRCYNGIVKELKDGMVLPGLSKSPISFDLADTLSRSGNPGILKFIHMANYNQKTNVHEGIDTGGWIRIKDYIEMGDRTSKTTFEVNVDFNGLKKIIHPDNAPVLRWSWDIEVDSHDGQSFPKAENRKDVIFMISNNFRVEGEKQSRLKILQVIKECDEIKPHKCLDDGADVSLAKDTRVVILEYKDEVALIKGWAKLIN